MAENIFWHEALVSRQERNRLNKHGSGVVWFTGLPSSGKSTIAHHLEKALFDRGIRAYVLDGKDQRRYHSPESAKHGKARPRPHIGMGC